MDLPCNNKILHNHEEYNTYTLNDCYLGGGGSKKSKTSTFADLAILINVQNKTRLIVNDVGGLPSPPIKKNYIFFFNFSTYVYVCEKFDHVGKNIIQHLCIKHVGYLVRTMLALTMFTDLPYKINFLR